MALDDFVEPEVAVAVAVTAAVASPSVRKVLRRGVVYGLAGLMIARDKVAAVASGVAQGARQAVAEAEQEAKETSSPSKSAPAAETAPT
jgi:hypothetical protein